MCLLRVTPEKHGAHREAILLSHADVAKRMLTTRARLTHLETVGDLIECPAASGIGGRRINHRQCGMSQQRGGARQFTVSPKGESPIFASNRAA